MAKQLYANNAKGKLNAGISAVATAAALQAGQGALMPNPAGGDWFLLTLVDASGNIEIVKITQRTGDSLDVIVRAQEGTAARIFAGGDKAELRWTKGSAEYLRDNLNAPAGTRMPFQQTTPPTGWTKEVGAAYNDAALRLVTGAVTPTGGADVFTTVFGAGKLTGGHSITQAELPNVNFTVTDTHYHTTHIGKCQRAGGLGAPFVDTPDGDIDGFTIYQTSGPAGGSIIVASGGAGTAHDHTRPNMNLKYADFVIGQKD